MIFTIAYSEAIFCHDSRPFLHGWAKSCLLWKKNKWIHSTDYSLHSSSKTLGIHLTFKESRNSWSHYFILKQFRRDQTRRCFDNFQNIQIIIKQQIKHEIQPLLKINCMLGSLQGLTHEHIAIKFRKFTIRIEQWLQIYQVLTSFQPCLYHRTTLVDSWKIPVLEAPGSAALILDLASSGLLHHSQRSSDDAT